ncbi:MAG: hypothetical protein RLY31_2216 [Bacteroidota bacterium]|jgi:hypothetical protein
MMHIFRNALRRSSNTLSDLPAYAAPAIHLLFRLLPAMLLAYTACRAYHISLTHDECGSFSIWTTYDILGCRKDPNCWGTANLHWLYVWLMQGTVRLFGSGELAIRLPALLGHALYLLFSWRLANRIVPTAPSHHPGYAMATFVLLNANPFLLEFHALARGYGLAAAFLMMSLYFVFEWWRSRGFLHLAFAFCGAFLAVLSSFTQLYFFAALVATAALTVLTDFLRQEPDRHTSLRSFSFLTIFFGGLLHWLLQQPISWLQENGEFEYGAPSFLDMMHSVVKTSLYGVRYLREYNVELFGGLFLLLLLPAGIRNFRHLLRKPSDRRAQPALGLLLLPLAVASETIVHHHLLDSEYLVNRTALLFIPLLATALAANLPHAKDTGKGLLVASALCCTIHFARAAQCSYTSEWGYDAQTRNMLRYLQEKLPREKQIRLGVHWLFHPSGAYYVNHLPFDSLAEPLAYRKTLRTDDYYDYYYVQPSDTTILRSQGYVVDRQFSWVGCLMRRKDLPE